MFVYKMIMELCMKRDFYFDNIKGILIFLVIFGHLIEVLNKKSNLIASFYGFIYIFHMPMFILINGYFFKKNNYKRIFKIIKIYLIWQLFMYSFIKKILKGQWDKILEVELISSLINYKGIEEILSIILEPKYTYWYLIALIFWQLITQLIPKKYYLIFPIFLISYIPLSLLNTSNIKMFCKIISFYPYFYIGYLMKKENFEILKKYISKKQASIILIFTYIVTVYIFCVKKVYRQITYGDRNYLDLNLNIQESLYLKTLIIMLSIIIIMCLLILINNIENILTIFGRNSLILYLVHSPLIYTFKQYVKVETKFKLGYLIISFFIAYGYCVFISEIFEKRKLIKICDINNKFKEIVQYVKKE